MDVEDLAYSSVFSRLIGFFLGTQKHSRNISSVHGFPGHTVTMFGNDDSNSNRNVTEVIDLTSKKKTTLHMQHPLWYTLCYYCTTMTWKIPKAKFSSRRISLQGSSFTLIWHYKCSGKLSTKFKKVNSF